MLSLFEGNLGPLETLRFIEDKLNAGIWRWDPASGSMEWSGGFFSLIGCDSGSVHPSFAALQQMIHPDDRFSRDELHEFLQAGTPLDREFRVIKKNGRVRWISSRIEALFDTGGRVTRAIGVSYDVTKQREQLQYQKSLSARFDALLSSIDGSVCIVDSVGTVIRLLKGSEETPGLSEPWIHIVHPDDHADVEQKIRNSRSQSGRQDFEHRSRRCNGLNGWMRTTVVPVHDDHRSQQEWIHLMTAIDLERRYLPAAPNDSPQLTGAQIRAARGILAMSVKELSDVAQVSPSVIRRLEEFNGPNAPEPALTKIRAALVAEGIEFIFPRAGEPSVRPQPRPS